MSKRAVIAAFASALGVLACPTVAGATFKAPPLPPRMPTIVAEDCPTIPAAACADTAAGIVYAGQDQTRFINTHELGHFADAETLDSGERNRWMTLVHASPRVWRRENVQPDGSLTISRGSPSEQFADAYAACRMRMWPEGIRGRGNWESSTTYSPRTNATQRRNCAFIARAVATAAPF